MQLPKSLSVTLADFAPVIHYGVVDHDRCTMRQANFLALQGTKWDTSFLEDSSLRQLVLEHYDRERTPLLRYVSFLGIEAQSCEDIVQESFLRLHEHLLAEGDRSNLRAWLFRVAHNLSRNRQTASYSGKTDSLSDLAANAEPIAGSASPEHLLLEDERETVLRRAVEQLSPAQKQCLALRAQGLKVPANRRSLTAFCLHRCRKCPAFPRAIKENFMSESGHLDTGLILRALDDELSAVERLAFESHIAGCEQCSARYREFGVLSVNLDALITDIPVSPMGTQRLDLERELLRREQTESLPAKRRWARSLGVIAAVAASLVFGILTLPRVRLKENGASATRAQSFASATFEADGESFASLPYSNADLPMNAHHVVRMRVPVSSLLDAGVIFEPISNEAASGDRSVLADVLLGMDGEPLGVHVVSAE